MKTTKKRLLNIIVATSIAINLVMLGALGYIANLDHNIDQLNTAMEAPVFIYVPPTTEALAAAGATASK